MATITDKPDTSKVMRHSMYVLGATVCILLIPAIAMQFTNEVAWGPEDFIVGGALLAGTGLLFVFGSRQMRTRNGRIGLGVVLALALLTVWAELAVGIFH